MKKKTQEKEVSQDDVQSKGTDIKENTNINEGEGKESETTSSNTGKNNQGNESTEDFADKIVSDIKAIEEKLAEMQDKYIRLSAEFDNYRKRTLREKMELSKYAEENVLEKIIPFMDDFERALQHIDSSSDIEALKSGIDLIYSKFSEFLRQNGIKEIEALNNDFNVDLHEAVAKVHVDEPEKKGKIVDVALKGYYLRDKVLRFAKVVVGE